MTTKMKAKMKKMKLLVKEYIASFAYILVISYLDATVQITGKYFVIVMAFSHRLDLLTKDPLVLLAKLSCFRKESKVNYLQ